MSLATAATIKLDPAEGNVNFYKHTGPADDVYTAYPSATTIDFMNSHWQRLLTYSGYWDQGNKLSWYSKAWAYADSYAIYSDPSYLQFAQLVQEHPDWILKDAHGNRLYIPYGCSGGSCPQYAANITDPNGFRAWWIAQVSAYFNNRNPAYKGIFIDDVNLDLSRVSDGWGNSVAPIDPATGYPMTNAAWRKYFADFMEQVRAAFPGVEIVHNSLWFFDWPDPDIQRQIQAADWINIERGVNDAGLTGGTGYWSVYRLLSFVDYVHANGRGVIFDGAADSDAAREYSAAVYLLTSSGSDLVGDSSQTPSSWWIGFEGNLGAAQGPRYSWQNLWRRDFAGGMVLVNPPGSASITVSLPAALIRLDGSVVNSIAINGGQGAVLWAPAAISTLACNPSEIPAGGASSCTVGLGAPAPSGGVLVSLSSTNSLLQVPASVTVAGGSTSAGFTATAGTVRYTQPASITASVNQSSQTTTFNLIGSGGPPPPPSCQISSGTSGATVTFKIQDANVGLAQIVLIQSINATVSVPSFVRGTLSPVAVTAAQVDLSGSSRADFQVSNMAGGTTACGMSFGRSVWSGIGGKFVGKAIVARNADGRLQLFFHGADHALWTLAQAVPGGGWLTAQSLGGVIIGDPAVGVNADGRLEAFALGSDSSLWHIYQNSPGGTWSSWSGLGGRLTSNPTVSSNQDGRLEVFGLGTDRTLWHIWQSAPGGAWSQWSALGGASLGNPVVIANRDGRLEVFAIAAGQKLWHSQQTIANGNWSGWTSLNAKLAGVPSPVMNPDGRLEVFVRGVDNALWHVWQTSPGGSWSSFQSLGGILTSDPSAVMNADSRLEVFARGADNALWSIAQKAPGSSWRDWGSLGGVLAGEMTAAQNLDGRVEVFGRGSDNTLWSIRQIAPGSWN